MFLNLLSTYQDNVPIFQSISPVAAFTLFEVCFQCEVAVMYGPVVGAVLQVDSTPVIIASNYWALLRWTV